MPEISKLKYKNCTAKRLKTVYESDYFRRMLKKKYTVLVLV